MCGQWHTGSTLVTPLCVALIISRSQNQEQQTYGITMSMQHIGIQCRKVLVDNGANMVDAIQIRDQHDKDD